LENQKLSSEDRAKIEAAVATAIKTFPLTYPELDIKF
jgi:hypothetical protein